MASKFLSSHKRAPTPRIAPNRPAPKPPSFDPLAHAAHAINWNLAASCSIVQYSIAGVDQRGHRTAAARSLQFADGRALVERIAPRL